MIERDSSIAALEWQLAAGVDETIAALPVDRFAPPPAAPPARPAPEARQARPARPEAPVQPARPAAQAAAAFAGDAVADRGGSLRGRRFPRAGPGDRAGDGRTTRATPDPRTRPCWWFPGARGGGVPVGRRGRVRAPAVARPRRPQPGHRGRARAGAWHRSRARGADRRAPRADRRVPAGRRPDRGAWNWSGDARGHARPPVRAAMSEEAPARPRGAPDAGGGASLAPSLLALLEEMVERDASDLHLTAGIPPRFRIDGSLSDARDGGALTPRMAARLVRSVLSAEQRERLAAAREVDFALDLAGLARFRCSCFRRRGHPAMALRRIPHEIRPLEDLGLPDVVGRLVERPRGLVLVTGPTGSGKSTTLAAMLNRINETRRGHIVTIEDPVEFVHPSRGCVVSQREVGSDTRSFAAALRSATRQDPDVILIGEMRDPETISAALTIAETGHLVLATLHTNSAAASVHRIIDVFGSGRQVQVRAQLALVLEGVLTQDLLPPRASAGAGPGLRGVDLHAGRARRHPRRQGPPDSLDDAGGRQARHANHERRVATTSHARRSLDGGGHPVLPRTRGTAPVARRPAGTVAGRGQTPPGIRAAWHPRWFAALGVAFRPNSSAIRPSIAPCQPGAPAALGARADSSTAC